MSTKYYVDDQGTYIGGFEGVEPPAGAIEVPTAPDDARQPWTGEGWGAAPVPPRIFSKRALFLSLTDEEYDTFAAIEAQQPARDRRAFAEATELNEADADWPQFLGLMHATYGETRTAEILDAAAL